MKLPAIVFLDGNAAPPHKPAVIGYSGWSWSDQVFCIENTNDIFISTAAFGSCIGAGVVFNSVNSKGAAQWCFSSSSAYAPKEVNNVAFTGYVVGRLSLLPNVMSNVYGAEWSTGTIEQNTSTGRFISFMERSRLVTSEWRNGMCLNYSLLTSRSSRRKNSPSGITLSHTGDRYRVPHLPGRTFPALPALLPSQLSLSCPVFRSPSHPAPSHTHPLLRPFPHLWPAAVRRLRLWSPALWLGAGRKRPPLPPAVGCPCRCCWRCCSCVGPFSCGCRLERLSDSAAAMPPAAAAAAGRVAGPLCGRGTLCVLCAPPAQSACLHCWVFVAALL